MLVALGVKLAGGKPVRVTADNTHGDTALDGVILGGGQDIFPMLFDDTPKQGYAYDRARDEMEIKLCEAALEKDVPILGICRGAQLLNVAYGGSLHLDLTKAYEDAHYPDSLMAKIFFRKTITTTSGSLLRRALGTGKVRVNSLHKQAIKTLGDGLAATAVESNGVVQAIEDASRNFVLGVQFHPEFMLHKKMFRNIFSTFVEAARTTPSLNAAAVSAIAAEVKDADQEAA